MTFKPGEPRPSGAGRRAGTPNKRTNELKDSLTEHGVDPVAEIVQLLPELEPKEKVNALLRLLEFIFPKRKAIEIPHVEDEDNRRPTAVRTPQEQLQLIQLIRAETAKKES